MPLCPICYRSQYTIRQHTLYVKWSHLFCVKVLTRNLQSNKNQLQLRSLTFVYFLNAFFSKTISPIMFLSAIEDEMKTPLIFDVIPEGYSSRRVDNSCGNKTKLLQTLKTKFFKTHWLMLQEIYIPTLISMFDTIYQLHHLNLTLFFKH